MDVLLPQSATEIRRPADGFCVPGYVPGQGGEYFTYNPEKAREHLAKSGFTGPLTLFANLGSAAVTWMPMVCEMISETLGIECTMNREMPFGEYLPHVVGQAMPALPLWQEWSVSGYSRKLTNVKVDIFTDLIVTDVRVADAAI